ncbi:MAG: DUF5667 domain-containing protein [Candidatus Paceibacterota bacterium]|jgi:hypothetical protein
MLTTILIVLALGGGTSAIAQSSLPGDILYPVKISVNDEIRTNMAFSARAKAEAEAKIAEDRLEEAEKLAIRGDLKADVKAKLEENFKKHAERFLLRIKQLGDGDKANVALDKTTDFGASLQAHQAILFGLAVKYPENKEELNDFNTSLNETVSLNASAQEEAESKVANSGNKVMVQAAAEGKLGAAENKIAEVRAYLEKIDASAEVKMFAELKLKAAEGFITEANAKLQAKAYGEAFILYQKALRTAQEAKSILNGFTEIKIDMNDFFKIGDDDDTQEEKDSVNASTEINASGEANDDKVGVDGSIDVKINN